MRYCGPGPSGEKWGLPMIECGSNRPINRYRISETGVSELKPPFDSDVSAPHEKGQVFVSSVLVEPVTARLWVCRPPNEAKTWKSNRTGFAAGRRREEIA
jgi:hypothetical protein